MTKMFEIAKEKDNGFFAKIGMQKTLADIWRVDINSECVEYTVDTFLECVDTMVTILILIDGFLQ